jgi:hypothetical protein
MLYLAYFPKKTDNLLDVEWFRSAPSRLLELDPAAGALEGVVRVIDCATLPGGVWLRADATAQSALVFRVG